MSAHWEFWEGKPLNKMSAGAREENKASAGARPGFFFSLSSLLVPHSLRSADFP